MLPSVIEVRSFLETQQNSCLPFHLRMKIVPEFFFFSFQNIGCWTKFKNLVILSTNTLSSRISVTYWDSPLPCYLLESCSEPPPQSACLCPHRTLYIKCHDGWDMIGLSLNEKSNHMTVKNFRIPHHRHRAASYEENAWNWKNLSPSHLIYVRITGNDYSVGHHFAGGERLLKCVHQKKKIRWINCITHFTLSYQSTFFKCLSISGCSPFRDHSIVLQVVTLWGPCMHCLNLLGKFLLSVLHGTLLNAESRHHNKEAAVKMHNRKLVMLLIPYLQTVSWQGQFSLFLWLLHSYASLPSFNYNLITKPKITIMFSTFKHDTKIFAQH
jgi:hypothetical protein